MKTQLHMPVLTVLCVGLIQIQGLGQSATYRPGKLIVKFQVENDVPINIIGGVPQVGIPEIDTLNVRHKCLTIEKIYKGPHPSARNLFLFSFPDDSDVLELVKLYSSIKDVWYTEPDLVFRVASTPNDPLYSQQWGLPKIDASLAWDIQQGSAGIIVSINDTGLDWQHPDIQANLWVNDEEDVNNNGVFDNFSVGTGGDIDALDNDSNGYIDDVIGWNFNLGNNNPQHTSGAHGTNVTGTVAAATNNAIGMAGVSWNSKIMACRVGNGSSINLSNATAGIYYAINNGARVINMSWTGSTTASLDAAIIAAANSNVVMAAAAGNNSLSSPFFPASHALVLGVAALEQDDTKRFNSNYGTWIDISAPAFNIFLNYVPGDPNPHQYSSGAATSTASPFVSGLAALILSVNSSLSDDDVRDIILKTADNIDAVNPSYIGLLGTGRINAYQALLLTHAYSNKSMSANATATNNGRRMAVESNGKYHLVFESGVSSGGQILSEILYRNSKNGSTWSAPVRLSAGNEKNNYPTIVERSGKLYVIWQRTTGTNTYDIHLRHYNGSAWETAIQTVASGISVTSDPRPVIAISSPSANFEMMAAYRTGSGIKSRRSVSSTGASWETELTVTSSTSAANPSLAACSCEPYLFRITYNDNNHVYSRQFQFYGWGGETNVSSGLGSSANTHNFSSFSVSANNDRHIVWHAYDPTLFNNLVVFHNRNLNTTVFTKFYSGAFGANYTRPNVSGLSNGAAAIFWNESNLSTSNVRKAQWNGSSWIDGSAGTIYGTNGVDVSGAMRNPPAGSVKAV